jgi:hypothetical protein
MAKTPKTAATTANTPSQVPPMLTNPNSVQAYQELYEALGRAYWDATDIQSKDTVQGVREAVYDIITNLDEAQLDANTAKFLALVPTIKSANAAIAKIQDRIDQITKNINTAASVIAAISKVLSLTSAL